MTKLYIKYESKHRVIWSLFMKMTFCLIYPYYSVKQEERSTLKILVISSSNELLEGGSLRNHVFLLF